MVHTFGLHAIYHFIIILIFIIYFKVGILPPKTIWFFRDTKKQLNYMWNISPVNNPSVRKSLRKCFVVLDVNHNNSVWRFGDDKSKHKSMRIDSMLWSIITMRLCHTKMNVNVKISVYDCINHRRKVLKYIISNGWLKLSIYGYYKNVVA